MATEAHPSVDESSAALRAAEDRLREQAERFEQALRAADQELRRAHRETREALDRQAATAEILKVISSSPTDTQPVFEAIARSVVRLCEGLYTYVGLYDGKMLSFVAYHNVSPAALAILVDAETRDAVGDRLCFEPMEAVRFKGKSAASAVFAVSQKAPAAPA